MLNDLVRRYQQLKSESAIDIFSFLSSHAALSHDAKLEFVLWDLVEQGKSGKFMKVEVYLEKLPEFASNPDAIMALVKMEHQVEFGDKSSPSLIEVAERFPVLGSHLQEALRTMDSKAGVLPIETRESETDSILNTMDSQVAQDCDPLRTIAKKIEPQNSILASRYQIQRLLGQGVFGRVYLALDIELQRQVAIKVPASERFRGSLDVDQYLAEARTVASLNHPNIVPVYDMGRTPEGAVFVVSRFVDGGTLDDRLQADRMPFEDLVRMLKTIAEALHFAHGMRLVHRDVKPANILIEERTQIPFVADFGLAIREEDFAKQGGMAGTPSYMSPEQARGEGHRLDGRSDVFSLGVILYEALTGRLPFLGSSLLEVLHQVVSVEPLAPRAIRSEIPIELERICLKSLSKRASERYVSAAALAEDLAAWLQSKTTAVRVPQGGELITPKGLRSFDSNDASYFLDLLPGPKNRDGLPQSVAFWKAGIEQTDPDQTFKVGLIYGPSGCGKSSLVKAGLIPHLDRNVISVYVEATPEDTETRLLRGLRKRLPELPLSLGLVDTLAALRRGVYVDPANETAGGKLGPRKVVLIVDQFEQWLHEHRTEEEAELVKALRHCDGGRVQAIIMVRDDFAMAAARFMNALDLPIIQGVNFATVDLFDSDHAMKVLTKFGQAFGKLPADTTHLSAEQVRFIRSVCEGLGRDGKVVSVRLSLFAEMVKGKEWTSATLEQVGGTAGVGVNFLEETFSAPHSNPRHRMHGNGVRSVLRALLPEQGTDIKGHMRTLEELLSVSGYQGRTPEFQDLLRILDGELRLITPTDPEGESLTESSRGSSFATRYYQLTHDYLVPSLREWLTRKQQETSKGRAELKLAERSALWNTKPENRFLPSFLEWLSIRSWTVASGWSASQKRMMNHAGKVHGLRMGIAIAFLLAVTSIGMAIRGQVLVRQESTRIEGLVGRLLSCDPSQLPNVLADLDPHRQIATKFLAQYISIVPKTNDQKREQLHARLALVSEDKSCVEPLLEELLTNKVTYIRPIRDQLQPYQAELTERLLSILRNEREDSNRRFRAAVALPGFLADPSVWTERDLQFVAEQLAISNAEYQPTLRECLRPIGQRILVEMDKIFGNVKGPDAQRLSAANAFADYGGNDVQKLSQLLTIATPEQYGVLFPIVAAASTPATIEELSEISATTPPNKLGSSERIPFGKRRANAAITLLRLGERQNVLSVFDLTDDPEALTQFVFRCRERNINVKDLLDLFESVEDANNKARGAKPGALGNSSEKQSYDASRIRYALLLALGEYSVDEVPESQREGLVKKLGDIYREDPGAGVHSATGWLLRRWGQSDLVRSVDETPFPYTLDREWFTLAVTVQPAQEKETSGLLNGLQNLLTTKEPKSPSTKTFYYTFVVFQPGIFEVGSVADELEREKDELRHHVKLTRPFALLDREITMEELIAFKPNFAQRMQQFDASPKVSGFAADWYDSVAFCRWLGQQSGISEEDQAYALPESLTKTKSSREPNPLANGAPRNWPVDLDRRGFRLPTEAEWEVACRGPARTAYSFGGDAGLFGRFGWCLENSEKRVHRPRELRPSIRGLFDMHGNLFEWTHDWHKEFDMTSRKVPLIDPVQSEGGSYRVLRGGSWYFGASVCRGAYRFTNDPTDRTARNGFRLALSPSISKIDEK